MLTIGSTVIVFKHTSMTDVYQQLSIFSMIVSKHTIPLSVMANLKLRKTLKS